LFHSIGLRTFKLTLLDLGLKTEDYI
jgi:hypothetical protein